MTRIKFNDKKILLIFFTYGVAIGFITDYYKCYLLIVTILP